MKFKCDRCGYSNNLKSNFIRHLNRKVKCEPLILDISIDEILAKHFEENIGEHNVNTGEHNVNTGEHNVNTSEHNVHIDVNKSEQSKVFYCKYCDKEFKHLTSKCRHERQYCKEKKDLNKIYKQQLIEKENELKEKDKLLKEKEKEKKAERRKLIKRREMLIKETKKSTNYSLKSQVDMLKMELQKRDRQIDILFRKANIINDHSRNLNVNIKLNPFEKTDYSHLTDQDYLECIKHANMCIPHFIKKLHFDPDKPENHNILIKNLKSGYLVTNNGNKWECKSSDETIDFLVEDNANIIEDKIAYWEENNHIYTQKEKYLKILNKFPRFLERRSDSKYVKKLVEKEVKLVLFNNRDMIMDKLDHNMKPI